MKVRARGLMLSGGVVLTACAPIAAQPPTHARTTPTRPAASGPVAQVLAPDPAAECSDRYVDAAGVWRYDLSCGDPAASRGIEPSLVGYDDRCVRSYSDAAGLSRYDFSCAWRDPKLEEIRQRKIACVVSGGDWGRHGSETYEGCAWHARDAGKTCTDSAECESRVCEALAGAEQTRGVCRACVGDCAPSRTMLSDGHLRRMD